MANCSTECRSVLIPAPNDNRYYQSTSWRRVSCCGRNFQLPPAIHLQKKASGWSWQTYWITQASVCWFLAPPDQSSVSHNSRSSHDGAASKHPAIDAMRNSFLAARNKPTVSGAPPRESQFATLDFLYVGDTLVCPQLFGTLIPPLCTTITLSAPSSKTYGWGWVVAGIIIGVLGIAFTWLGWMDERKRSHRAKQSGENFP